MRVELKLKPNICCWFTNILSAGPYKAPVDRNYTGLRTDPTVVSDGTGVLSGSQRRPHRDHRDWNINKIYHLAYNPSAIAKYDQMVD